MKLISTGILFLLLFSCGQTQTKSDSKSMFDSTKLTESDKKILADFYNKRSIFDTYIKNNGLKLFTCPGCGYPTLSERGEYEICSVCNWEDNYQDDKDADKRLVGPNRDLSLTENRINIGRVLINNADSLKTKVNLDPKSVLLALKNYEKKKEEIENRMTGNEKPDHPIWKEWERVEKDLQVALSH